MNTEFKLALEYAELCKKELLKINKSRYVDSALEECDILIKGIKDDANQANKELNRRQHLKAV